MWWRTVGKPPLKSLGFGALYNVRFSKDGKKGPAFVWESAELPDPRVPSTWPLTHMALTPELPTPRARTTWEKGGRARAPAVEAPHPGLPWECGES